MKNNHIFYCLFIFLTAINLTVLQSCSVQKTEILTYNYFLDSLCKNKSEEVGSFVNPSLAEVKRAARIIFEAKQSDPIEEQKAFDSLHSKWESDFNKANKDRINLDSMPWRRPGTVQGEIVRKIAHSLPHRIYCLIRAPYLLRVRIIDNGTLKKSAHDKSQESNYWGTFVRAIVKEVISGQSFYSVNDTLYFKDFENPAKERDNYFQMGEECLVPLEPRVSAGGFVTIVLTTYLDDDIDRPYIDYGPCGSCGRYPIVNEILTDRKNTFGMGNKVKWTEFVKTIKEQLQEIKSW